MHRQQTYQRRAGASEGTAEIREQMGGPDGRQSGRLW